MRNIKLTEAEWKSIKEALVKSEKDFWHYAYPWLKNRKRDILNRAQGKIWSAKKEGCMTKKSMTDKKTEWGILQDLKKLSVASTKSK